MLLPSAITCESSQPHFLRSAAAFASPPASPPNTSAGPIGNIVSTCRSLQSLISGPAPNNNNMVPTYLPMPALNELPTPPMTHALPPLKLRLRSRRNQDSSDSHTGPRKRIVKRAPPRGLNKRRRDADDDMGRDDVDNYFSDSDSEKESAYTLDSVRPVPINFQTEMPSQSTPRDLPPRPSTPKQGAIAPMELPLGLERSDFHQNHTEDPDDASRAGTGIEVARDGESWSVEQDRKLVEVIIAHFKLSPEDMEDCARSLGKGSGCVERRWKSLVMNGDVVLKKRERRTRLHSTWGR